MNKKLILIFLALISVSVFSAESFDFEFGKNVTCRSSEESITSKDEEMCKAFYQNLISIGIVKELKESKIKQIFIKIPYTTDDGFEALTVFGKRDPLQSIKFSIGDSVSDIRYIISAKKQEFKDNKNAVTLQIQGVYCDKDIMKLQKCDDSTNRLLALKNKMKLDSFSFSNASFVNSWTNASSQDQTSDDAYFNLNESDDVWRMNIWALSLIKELEVKVEEIENILEIGNFKDAKIKISDLKLKMTKELDSFLNESESICSIEDCDLSDLKSLIKDQIEELDYLIEE